MWSIIDGALTVTTGGKLVDAKQNGTNWGAKSIQGGKANRVAKGDFLMIPEGGPLAVENPGTFELRVSTSADIECRIDVHARHAAHGIVVPLETGVLIELVILGRPQERVPRRS